MEVKNFKNDVWIFVYDDEIIKTITDPEIMPSNDDEVIINGFRYEITKHLVDMDTNKIYVFLE